MTKHSEGLTWPLVQIRVGAHLRRLDVARRLEHAAEQRRPERGHHQLRHAGELEKYHVPLMFQVGNVTDRLFSERDSKKSFSHFE